MPALNQTQNFSHLSIKDLVEARDMFHVHLMNKKNVVATAVGRYLFRIDDIDENGKYNPSVHHTKKPARTLGNSVVIDISWPCILVFVKQWDFEDELIKEGGSNIVPKTLYMPDGRVVPVCIVEAPRNEVTDTDININDIKFPTNLIGGGFPVIVESQMEEHYATIGCLVSDGHTYYALTNKHVSGSAGQVIKSKIGGSIQKIGVSSGKELGKVPFKKLYPGWNSSNIMIACDAGLIEIDDIRKWTTALIGNVQMDELYDLNTMNLSLGLIAEHAVYAVEEGKKRTRIVADAKNGLVIGYAAISGQLQGEIKALFYRYNSIGGVEYASDFLIGGRKLSSLNVHYGDSGTLWLLEGVDEEKKQIFQPIALHWGQHQLINGNDKSQFSYSLSTSLSNICREMEVELVRGWNLDVEFSWGKVGHYTVGNKAIAALSAGKLKNFMTKNLENVSLKDEFINKDLDKKDPTNKKEDNPHLPTNPDKGFCPLADVPDIIWKQIGPLPDGKGTPWGRKGHENPNHFADADAPVKRSDENLFSICSDVSKMTVEVWKKYYESVDEVRIGLDPTIPVTQGLICFRVWQIFDYMVEAVKSKKADQFIFAAGVLAHYVGDGCQPLHSSYMADGDPKDNVPTMYTPPRGGPKHPKGIPYQKIINAGSGVHVAYEDTMIDDHIGAIMPQLNFMLDDKHSAINKEHIMHISTGQEAAFAVLTLMKKTQLDIPPIDIVSAFKKAKVDKVDISNALFDAFGDKTVLILARGCRYLAAIWAAAWKAGGGDTKFSTSALGKVSPESLIALYREPANLPSMHLDTIGPLLK